MTILDDLRRLDVEVPLLAMTYYNIAHHAGLERFAEQLAAAGVCGAILPDAPLEEIGPWQAAAEVAGVETVLLAAPTSPDDRLPRLCEASRGFVYSVGLLGVTGVRSELASSARDLARRLKAVTDKPVLIGVGVGSPEQAAEAVLDADGVVIGSVIVQSILEGRGPEALGELIAAFRAAIDASPVATG
jgi:tryptophan synthase alpha chain